MDAEIKSKWVAALRSGEYTQGEGALKRRFADEPVVHCCIGVLAEVAGLQLDERPTSEAGRRTVRWSVDGDDGQLSDAVLEQLGLTNETQSELIDMNDNRDLDFNDIARYIEENL